jgi:UTP--glucose-1-phosphate uridylyltransferase
MNPHDLPLLREIDDDTRATLRRFRFDPGTFSTLLRRFVERAGEPSSNHLTVSVEPPAEGDLATMPSPGSARWDRLEAIGLEAILDGAFAAVVLNGGMATRFGGVVKGTVEVLDGRSFLQLAAERVRRLASRAGGTVPMLLMNSFATAEATAAHLERTGWLGLDPGDLRCFDQSVFPRITPAGTLFRDDHGEASLYGPGHGDFPSSIRDSGALDWLAGRGVRHVGLYNVDNLGAAPHPVILGHHIDRGAPMTAELVPKDPGDKGGAPARVAGHLEVVEDFRFPDGFDQDSIPVFNCNTFVFDVDLLRRDFPLDWFTVTKRAFGRQAVQFEHLVGQVTAFLDASYLVVPRRGPESRFLPVKRPGDLDDIRPVLREIFG